MYSEIECHTSSDQLTLVIWLCIGDHIYYPVIWNVIGVLNLAYMHLGFENLFFMQSLLVDCGFNYVLSIGGGLKYCLFCLHFYLYLGI